MPRNVGLFYKADRMNCVWVVESILNADYGPHEVNFVSGEPGNGAGALLDSRFEALDFAVSIGGDGTFLRAARTVRDLGIPLYGINAGRLGFLASGKPESAAEDIKRILSGNYEVFSRSPLRCEISRGSSGTRSSPLYALNEVTLSKGTISRPIELCVRARGEILYRFLADGIIVSTPTGSTAYSLSAGGPVVHPDVRCLVVTPICPHSLYPRPIVLGESETVEIALEGENEGMTLSCDGMLNIGVARGDAAYLELDRRGVDIIRLDYSSYYEALRRKLNWGLGSNVSRLELPEKEND